MFFTLKRIIIYVFYIKKIILKLKLGIEIGVYISSYLEV